MKLVKTDWGRAAMMCGVAVSILSTAGLAWGEDDEKKDGWTGEFALSGSAQTGTVDTISGTIDTKAEREWTRDFLTFRLLGSYGRTRDGSDNPSKEQTTQNSQGAFATWQRTIYERFFWNSPAELSRDTTQDREVRFALSTGPGYRFWWVEEDEEARHFDGKLGVGYRYELYDGNTGPGPNNENGYDRQLADLVASFEYKNMLFDDKIEWSHTASIAVPANDPNAFIGRTEVIMGVPLTASWSFRTTFLFEWTNDTPDNINSALTRTTLGLGYKF